VQAAGLGIKTLIVYGEPGGSQDETRARLSAGFGGAEIFDLMGATGCHSPTAISCEANAGLHFFAHDSCLFEVLDPKTLTPLPLEEGVVGEAVYTGLDKECAPLLRWRDKDIVRIHTRPCACGRPGFRFYVEGRADDMLLVKGVNVYPNAIKDVVARFGARVTGAIRVVKPGPSPVAPPPLLVRVERASELSNEASAALVREIEEDLHHKLRFRARVELVPAGALGAGLGPTHKSLLVEIST
jgi:phenylacetate-CoA ligase